MSRHTMKIIISASATPSCLNEELIPEVNKVFFLSISSGDKPAAMKHSNQSDTVDTKSSASSGEVDLLYNILKLILSVMYSLSLLDS